MFPAFVASLTFLGLSQSLWHTTVGIKKKLETVNLLSSTCRVNLKTYLSSFGPNDPDSEQHLYHETMYVGLWMLSKILVLSVDKCFTKGQYKDYRGSTQWHEILALNYCIQNILECDFKHALLATDYLNNNDTRAASPLQLSGSLICFQIFCCYQKAPPLPHN